MCTEDPIFAVSQGVQNPFGLSSSSVSQRCAVRFIYSILHLAANNPFLALREDGDPKFRVLENPPQVPQGTLLINQNVAYYRDAFSSSPTKVRNSQSLYYHSLQTMNSLLTFELGNEGRLKHHTEGWDHEKSSTSG
ncbi:hypothetical protein DFJ58DRAFT_772281 [Suillus subalutaceus]|uniref:uncharacterized protein n=1 Tax=Suillus subalutaceus TaxID=48586 RepID=UPI001B8722B0|nr:uncharacterized protein DFJ58DRAFT_772281 [Suillus subalutaceus]KAG1864659.1 hypothetical protein DFJ58DRAFT_772281 [Suillus subalutaceus]